MSTALLHFPTDGFSKGSSSEVVDFVDFDHLVLRKNMYVYDSYYTGLSSGGEFQTWVTIINVVFQNFSFDAAIQKLSCDTAKLKPESYLYS